MHEHSTSTPDETGCPTAGAADDHRRTGDHTGHAAQAGHAEPYGQNEHVGVGDADWRCPMCSCAVIRPHRPGRARVYCTNACRQKAYRWRLQRRDRLRVAQPPQRARTHDRTHALRADDDVITPLADGRGRRVTACGTFAMAARDNPHIHRHVRFFSVTNVDRHTGIARSSSSTCQRCTDLLGVSRRPIEQVLAEIDQSW